MKSRLIAVVCMLALAVGCGWARCEAQERAPEKAEKPEKPAQKIKAVKFGKLWDGKGKVWMNAIVIVDGDRVREVTTDAKRIPPQAEVVDLSKYYGLPGLIDVHTHMTLYTDETPGVPMLKQVANNSPAVEVFLAR